MSARVVRGLLWVVAMATLLPGVSAADATGHYNYADREDVRTFIADMRKEYGFNPAVLTRWLTQAQRQDNVLTAISRPAEKALEWGAYRSIFMQPERISMGREFLSRYRDAFDRAEQTYGVSRYVIAAIIGVETRYGQVTGDYRVLDSLVTLAFDYPPRSAFFRSELGQFFLMVREQGMDPLTLQGSYAGAMGYGQFIASSYRHYAVDFNGDQVANIISDPVDAIGSVANYFSEHGWQMGQPVAEQISDTTKLAPDSQLLTDGLAPTKTVKDYRRAGLQPMATLALDAPARAIRLNGSDGPELWLTYQNFYVITRYNHSPLYAMAVYQLAEALQAHHG